MIVIGAQFVHPDFMNDGLHTDRWCENTSNVVLPALCMPAHTAPLDVVFYENDEGKWPVGLGDAFVSLHGSWNRQPAQGYKVLHVKFDSAGKNPVAWVPLFQFVGPGDTGTGWPYRPAGLTMANCGNRGECLLVSSDSNGDIIAIVFEPSQLDAPVQVAGASSSSGEVTPSSSLGEVTPPSSDPPKDENGSSSMNWMVTVVMVLVGSVVVLVVGAVILFGYKKARQSDNL